MMKLILIATLKELRDYSDTGLIVTENGTTYNIDEILNTINHEFFNETSNFILIDLMLKKT